MDLLVIEIFICIRQCHASLSYIKKEKKGIGYPYIYNHKLSQPKNEENGGHKIAIQQIK